MGCCTLASRIRLGSVSRNQAAWCWLMHRRFAVKYNIGYDVSANLIGNIHSLKEKRFWLKLFCLFCVQPMGWCTLARRIRLGTVSHNQSAWCWHMHHRFAEKYIICYVVSTDLIGNVHSLNEKRFWLKRLLILCAAELTRSYGVTYLANRGIYDPHYRIIANLD